MKRISDVLCLGCLVVGGLGMAAAQEQSMGPPKVLMVTREFVKPGKTGAMHDKARARSCRRLRVLSIRHTIWR